MMTVSYMKIDGHVGERQAERITAHKGTPDTFVLLGHENTDPTNKEGVIWGVSNVEEFTLIGDTENSS